MQGLDGFFLAKESRWKKLIEKWVTILEAPDYEVSETGKIRNKKSKNSVRTRVIKRFGYVLVNLQVGARGKRKQKTFRVHRLVAKAFIPNPDNLPQVDHINGVKTDEEVKEDE